MNGLKKAYERYQDQEKSKTKRSNVLVNNIYVFPKMKDKKPEYGRQPHKHLTQD